MALFSGVGLLAMALLVVANGFFVAAELPAGVYAWSSSMVGASGSRGSFHQTGITLPTPRAVRDGRLSLLLLSYQPFGLG
jgi:hypothetical protein